eukprot:gene27127-32770_t
MKRSRFKNLESSNKSAFSSCDDYFGDDYMAPLDHYPPAVDQPRLHVHKSESVKPLSKRKLVEFMEEKTVEALNIPIPSSNKGFQLLSKLGFTHEEGLGRSSVASLKEPISILDSIKAGQSGIGYGNPKVSQIKAKMEIKVQQGKLHQQLESGFQNESICTYKNMRLKKEVLSVQKVMYELDLKKNLPVHSLTEYIHRKYSTMTDNVASADQEDVAHDDLVSDDCTEYNDENDLNSCCPGFSYDDH